LQGHLFYRKQKKGVIMFTGQKRKVIKLVVGKDLISLAKNGDKKAFLMLGKMAQEQERFGYAKLFLRFAE